MNHIILLDLLHLDRFLDLFSNFPTDLGFPGDGTTQLIIFAFAVIMGLGIIGSIIRMAIKGQRNRKADNEMVVSGLMIEDEQPGTSGWATESDHSPGPSAIKGSSYCSFCGGELLTAEDKFCPNCGADLDTD